MQFRGIVPYRVDKDPERRCAAHEKRLPPPMVIFSAEKRVCGDHDGFGDGDGEEGGDDAEKAEDVVVGAFVEVEGFEDEEEFDEEDCEGD